MKHFIDLVNLNALSEGYAIGKFKDENKWAVVGETSCISRRFKGNYLEDSTFRLPLVSTQLLDKVSFLPFKNGVSVVQINGRDPVVDDTGRRSLVLVSKSGIINCFSYANSADRQWWFEFIDRYFKSNRSFLMRKPEHFKDAEQLAFYADISQHGLLMRYAEIEKLEEQLITTKFKTQAELYAFRDNIINQKIELNREESELRKHIDYLGIQIEKRRASQQRMSKSANEKGYMPVKLKDINEKTIDTSYYGPIIL